jgi:hypothetical protein
VTGPDLTVVPGELERFQRAALVVGILFGIASVAGAYANPQQFFQSYLMAWLYWAGLAVGCLAVLMIHHLSGGSWGMVIRRILEAGSRTLPLLALLFVPVLLGMRHLFIWTRPEVLAADELIRHKAPYLNLPFFLARTVLYFAVWIALGFFLNRWSRRQDETGSDEAADRGIQRLSAGGLVLVVLTMTFASVDWVMSLEPHWFSTMFGALILVGQGLGGLSLAIATLILLSRYRPLSEIVTPACLHDLGKLLLAFVMVWAYFSFSQFLIIWAGNLPEEIPWYLSRLAGGWQWIGLALVLLHFVLPFMLLLSRSLKRDARPLAWVAVLVLVMHLVDVFWHTQPAFSGGDFRLHWLDAAATLGVGGIWLAFFIGTLRRRPLAPLKDPAVFEAMKHGGH